MQDVFPIYEAAWKASKAEGAFVHYSVLAYGAAGYFLPPDEDQGRRWPTISIHRPHYEEGRSPTRGRCATAPPDMPPPDILDELMTLAHEYGHFMSWKERTPRVEWATYHAIAIKRDGAWEEASGELPDDLAEPDWMERMRDAMRAVLTDDDRRRIVAEEELAWDIARELLVRLGFEQWQAFESHRVRGVHNHRYRLHLDELWPGDE